MLDECAVRAVRKIRRPKIHDGRLLITYSSGTQAEAVVHKPGQRDTCYNYITAFQRVLARACLRLSQNTSIHSRCMHAGKMLVLNSESLNNTKCYVNTHTQQKHTLHKELELNSQ